MSTNAEYQSSTFASGMVLLLNVWSGKRTGLPPEMTSTIAEVHKCMECIRVCEGRWANYHCLASIKSFIPRQLAIRRPILVLLLNVLLLHF